MAQRRLLILSVFMMLALSTPLGIALAQSEDITTETGAGFCPDAPQYGVRGEYTSRKRQYSPPECAAV